MKIVGAEGLDGQQLTQELERDAKFIVYEYCVSLFVVTFKRASDIYFVRGGDGRLLRGLPFSLVSLILGWWGIPWGPIHTIGSLITNFRGGRDVTHDVLSTLAAAAADEATE